MAATSGMPPLPPEFRQQLQQRFQAVQHVQQNPQVRQLSQTWNDLMRQLDSLPSGISVQDAISYVLRESYRETTSDLKFYAQKVQLYNTMNKALRSELSVLNELRERARGFQGGPGTAPWPGDREPS
jgi:RNA polymerase-interacting CarD/CdnL/TRCF family regulator